MSSSPTWEHSIELLERLPTLPTRERVDAVELLFRSASPMVRERALRTGAVVVPDDRIEAYLRSDADDVARNAGLEMLKLRGSKGVALAIRLLRDDDPDVVLQAVLALGHARDLRALEPLRSALAHADPNVVQAAIEAVGRLGDARAVADLVVFLDAEPWLQMAAIQALGELRDRAAIEPLAALLPDLLVGPLVAEAIARIGGTKAYRLLAAQLLQFGVTADTEGLLALLAHVIEGLKIKPAPLPGLAELLTELLESPEPLEAGDATRFAAARCLLSLAPSPADERAIGALVAGDVDALHLPACLEGRPDLVPQLLRQPSAARCWGLLLVERHPRSAAIPDLLQALDDGPATPELLKTAIRALTKVQRPALAAGLLARYQAASPERRRTLAHLVATQQTHLATALDQQRGLALEDRLVLAARAGIGLEEVARDIATLDVQQRIEVLEQLIDLPELTRILPWREWFEEDPDRWSDLAALAAGQLGLRELAPLLRARLAAGATPTLLRAVGDLGDRDSVPLLQSLIAAGDARVVPLALETLGRIGGPEARLELRRVVTERGPEERMAYRALSMCATPDDDEIFRHAVHHPDWYVRLACAEVLGRYSRPENLEALAQLASDTVPLVAQRAIASIER